MVCLVGLQRGWRRRSEKGLCGRGKEGGYGDGGDRIIVSVGAAGRGSVRGGRVGACVGRVRWRGRGRGLGGGREEGEGERSRVLAGDGLRRSSRCALGHSPVASVTGPPKPRSSSPSSTPPLFFSFRALLSAQTYIHTYTPLRPRQLRASTTPAIAAAIAPC